MTQKSSIEWTERTWNPLRGCTRISEGCRNCYAEQIAGRFSKPGQAFEGIATKTGGEARWTGEITFHENILLEPLSIKKPSTFFISMSDLFHENVSDEWIDKIFAVMALCPQHTFQILTKRADKMRNYLNNIDTRFRIGASIDTVLSETLANAVICANKQMELGDDGIYGITEFSAPYLKLFPLPNVMLGVSVENQKAADERIPFLLETPAAVRFLSCEPLLGELNLSKWMPHEYVSKNGHDYAVARYRDGETDEEPPCRICGQMTNGLHWIQAAKSMLDWVIAGGESGHGARPVHPDWIRSIRDQCAAANVPFFFKQWGSWQPIDEPWKQDDIAPRAGNERWMNDKGGHGFHGENVWRMRNIGKKKAGRTLDGRTWEETPK